MAASMTGVGFSEVTKDDIVITVEVRSVNNRYLEISNRLPAIYTAYEQKIKDLIRQYIHRGKVYINISIQKDHENGSQLKLVPEAVANVKQLLEALRDQTGIDEPIRLEHYMHYSEIFELSGSVELNETLWNPLEEAISIALKQLRKMRFEEGEALMQDIRKRLDLLSSDLNAIENQAAENTVQAHARMIDRVRALMAEDSGSPDDNRLYTEIAVMSDKLDITEECVRLNSHHGLFRQVVDDEEIVGKKLNFLLQEMNREVNTISSKASNASISHIVVNMKEQIEKLREQVQNLE